MKRADQALRMYFDVGFLAKPEATGPPLGPATRLRGNQLTEKYQAPRRARPGRPVRGNQPDQTRISPRPPARARSDVRGQSRVEDAGEFAESPLVKPALGTR